MQAVTFTNNKNRVRTRYTRNYDTRGLPEGSRILSIADAEMPRGGRLLRARKKRLIHNRGE